MEGRRARMNLHMVSSRGHSSMINRLDKKVPRNPRYANIQSKVKSGLTVDKLTFVTTRQHLRRQDEPFYRLSPSQLHELLVEYEQDRQEGVQDFRGHVDPDHHGPKVVVHEPDATPSYERPYLILDLRPPEEFRECHITQARSFEGMLLNQDHMTPELYMYKNKEGGLVVLYCNEEREACHAATTLTHRGFDNVFILSTGIVGFAKKFKVFVEGNMEALPRVAGLETSSLATSRRPRRHGGGGNVHGSSVCGTTTSTRSRSNTRNGFDAKDSAEGERRRAVTDRSNRYLGRPAATTNSIGRVTDAPSDRYSVNNGYNRETNACSTLTISSCGDSSRNRTIPASRVTQQERLSGSGRNDASLSHRKLTPRTRSYEISGAHGLGESAGGDGGEANRRTFPASVEAGSHRGLAEAVAAASAARRHSLGSSGELRSVDGEGRAAMSGGSAVSVAESVISRATARRGKW